MILDRRKGRYNIYLAPKPDFRHGLFSEFYLCDSRGCHFGFIRKPFFTKLIDLREDFRKDIDKQTLYEYRRAVKDGCRSDLLLDTERYIDFFNRWSMAKGRGTKPPESIRINADHMIFTAGYDKDGEMLVAHCYFVDRDAKRVILHMSSSLIYSGVDVKKKAEIGRCNRMLHIDDMDRFKAEGFVTYDLGGYAKGTSDKQLLGINSFKDSFGGVLVESSNYVNILRGAALAVLNAVNRIAGVFMKKTKLAE